MRVGRRLKELRKERRELVVRLRSLADTSAEVSDTSGYDAAMDASTRLRQNMTEETRVRFRARFRRRSASTKS